MPTAVGPKVFRATSTDGRVVVYAKTAVVARDLADGDTKVRGLAAKDPAAVTRGGKPAFSVDPVSSSAVPAWVLDQLAEDDLGVVCYFGKEG